MAVIQTSCICQDEYGNTTINLTKIAASLILVSEVRQSVRQIMDMTELDYMICMCCS